MLQFTATLLEGRNKTLPHLNFTAATAYCLPASQRNVQRKTDLWRAPDHRTLCHHCGEAGRTYCTCQYHQKRLRGFAYYASCTHRGESLRDITDYFVATQWTPRASSRLPSPGRYVHWPDLGPVTQPVFGKLRTATNRGAVTVR